MSVELKNNKKNIFLLGDVSHQIAATKLPSNRQVLAVLFFYIRERKLTVSQSANLVIRECITFWEKARIPTKAVPNCVKKLVKLHHAWRDLQKNCKKAHNFQRHREEEFKLNLDCLFDIAHADALKKIEMDEDRDFLQKQRKPGRRSLLEGRGRKLAKNKKRKTEKTTQNRKRG